MSKAKPETSQSYDLIGDIHGCNKSLASLLTKLGYSQIDQVYQHPTRKIIFLGDFIDRGPGQREVIDIVRPMIDSGAALAVMGNHEFNAIAYATKSSDGGYLRHHCEKNRNQHQAFLQDYPQGSPEHAEIIQWFKTLPLWLDLGNIRIVHACWDVNLIQELQQNESVDLHQPRLTDALLHAACQSGTWQYRAIECLLKGKEIKLPNGQTFDDKEGNPRRHIRVKWWDETASTYRQAFMGPQSAVTHIPNEPIHGDHLIVYGHNEPPVFLGHYWLEGQPEPLADNIACLDYSVARPGGKLVAYRWDGEHILAKEKFVSVQR